MLPALKRLRSLHPFNRRHLSYWRCHCSVPSKCMFLNATYPRIGKALSVVFQKKLQLQGFRRLPTLDFKMVSSQLCPSSFHNQSYTGSETRDFGSRVVMDGTILNSLCLLTHIGQSIQPSLSNGTSVTGD